MPPQVYRFMKEHCHRILGNLYDQVGTPIEGPEKRSFGDIDILVAGAKQLQPDGSPPSRLELDRDIKTIAESLEAHRVIHNTGEGRGSAHLALHWPDSMTDVPEGEDEAHFLSSLANRTVYIQVDIRICDSPEQQSWRLFKHAHGDIWNMLGSTIRPLGLTADETALFIRIPEVEKFNRRRAKIFLTADPHAVLEFLGLSVERFEKPFETLDEMNEYVAQSRMFWIKPASKDGSDSDEAARAGNQGADDNKAKLKSNDRRRMNQRLAFRKWIDEFIPSCREQGRFLDQTLTREAVQEEALDRFGAREQFEKDRAAFVCEKQLDVVRAAIKDAIPLEPGQATKHMSKTKYQTYRGVVIKAFRTMILLDDQEAWEKYHVEHISFKDDKGFWDLDRVTSFIRDNMDKVGGIAMAESLDRFQEHRERIAASASDQEK